jgi:CRP-like cAMP-binding protein
MFQPLANNFRVLSEVAQKIEHVYFHNNTIIYEERDLADYFYILLSGTVHLTVHEYIDPP